MKAKHTNVFPPLEAFSSSNNDDNETEEEQCDNAIFSINSNNPVASLNLQQAELKDVLHNKFQRFHATKGKERHEQHRMRDTVEDGQKLGTIGWST